MDWCETALFILGYTCTDGHYCENRGPKVTAKETVLREKCESDDTCTGYDYAYGYGEYGYTCSQPMYPGSKTFPNYKLCKRNKKPGE